MHFVFIKNDETTLPIDLSNHGHGGCRLILLLVGATKFEIFVEVFLAFLWQENGGSLGKAKGDKES